MKTPIIKILTALALSIATTHAVQIYTGSLSSGAGLYGTGDWESGSLFEWTVTETEQVDAPSIWHYSYTLTVLGKDLSHVTTEVSSNFTLDNLIGYIDDPGSILTGGSLDLYGPGLNGNSDPGIPANIYGIKVDTQGDTKEITWSLFSDRVPVWGDLYAKDGKSGGDEVYLYNDGFNADGPGGVDTDPLDPASNGSVEFHILVPDSKDEGPGIPEPSTSMLGVIGLMLILRRRNR